nr:NADH dehydrogenase subunit 4 [Pseudolycoriella hygida]
MMKFMFMLIFVLPIFMLKIYSFWLFQFIFLFMSSLFILFNYYFNYWSSISYWMGCDSLSYGMMLLSFWICSMMLMSSEKIYWNNNFWVLFIFMVFFLLLMLFLTFSMMSLFMFYLFFESSLIPTFFLILGWGYQPERLQAGYYLFFYTILASLPMLMGIIYCYNLNNSMIFSLMNLDYMYMLFYLSMILAFLVKMPMYLFHLWLPKAHVEAPISGSMILAGVLLKLGGYGLMRVLPLMMKISMKFNYLFIIISLFGGVLVSLMCLIQLDLKCLIAYSSVAHMGMVLSGIMTMNYWGLSCSYSLMIGHGLCSSGLFCLANMNYERVYSRSMLINKGLINFMPSLTMWWFLFSISNMACPPSLNLLGEIGLLNSIIGWSYLSMLFLSMLSFFSAVYSLYIYAFIQHGKFSSLLYSFSLGLIREYLLIILHWIPLNFMFLNSEIILFWL